MYKAISTLQFVLLLLLVLLLAAVEPALAERTIRLATVDINQLLNDLKESKAKRDELDKLSLSAKKKVDEKRTALKKMESDLRKRDVKRGSEEAEKFRKTARDYENFVRDTEEDLRRRFMNINNTLTEKVLAAIAAYAKRNDIDLVLDKSKQGRSPVLFGNPESDITSAVLVELNR